MASDVDSLIDTLRETQDRITAHAISVATRVARKVVRQYPWIDAEDLRSELLMRLPQWVQRYQPQHNSKTTWSKYLYHKMAFYAKDVLRKEDPLGIKWPQRKQYPEWFRLGDHSGRVSRLPDSSPGSLAGMDDLGRSLEYQADPAGDEEELQWQRDLEGLARFAAANRRRKSPPAMKSAGEGLAYHSSLPFWDRSKGRIRFKLNKKTTLAGWLEVRRKPQLMLF